MRKFSKTALTILEIIRETASDFATLAEVTATSGTKIHPKWDIKFDKITYRKMDARERRAKKRRLSGMINRLKKAGVIRQDGKRFILTKEGTKTLKESKGCYDLCSAPSFYPQFASKTDETIIVIFDIPEKERWKRNWFRRVLWVIGFTKLQQSVFVGHYTIPKQLLIDVEKLSLRRCVHFFTVKNSGSISEI